MIYTITVTVAKLLAELEVCSSIDQPDCSFEEDDEVLCSKKMETMVAVQKKFIC